MTTKKTAESEIPSPSGPWTDLGLTLPVFVGYHLGVVFLPVRNAADVVTAELVSLANNNLLAYSLLTLAIGLTYVGVLVFLGRGKALHWNRFFWVALEGVLYAVAMRHLAGYLVGQLFLAKSMDQRLTGVVMSFGAGFYEELVFRVVLFGLGAKLIPWLLPNIVPFKAKLVAVAWALVSALIFSGWHYVGALGDSFDLKTFTFRAACGLLFVVIYRFRGFAPAVWTHTLYDLWVLAL